MFTGIVQSVGQVTAIKATGVDRRVHIATVGRAIERLRSGDSIAVNGVCLTVVEPTDEGFWCDVSGETLSCTTWGRIEVGGAVNLEPALTPSTPLGGHLVSGHVDGVATVTRREVAGQSVVFSLQAADRLARYLAVKGTVCVDGVSLTINDVQGAVFSVNIVPHTLSQTTLDAWQPGSEVNIEVDIIARYLERLLLGEEDARQGGGITRALLARYGFTDE